METLTKKPNKKARVIFTLAMILTAILILLWSLTKASQAVTSFFEVNTLKFHNPISVELAKPVEVVSREQVAKDKALEEKSAWVADECLKMMIDSLTGTPAPTPKQTSMLVKPAMAQTSYTYLRHANKPYYQSIINWLQKEYTNWEDAAELIARESSFDPGVINPSSGACGIAQALPCKKMGCSLSDIECQLDWQKQYVADRYGTVANALKFQIANSWY